jgi:hypothetical protein
MVSDYTPEAAELTDVDESENHNLEGSARTNIDAVFEDWEEPAAPQAPSDESQDGACEEGSPHADVEAAERDADEADREKFRREHPELKPPDDTQPRVPLSSADATAGVRG